MATGVESNETAGAAELDYQMIMMRFLQACQQLRMAGTYIHHLRIHPDLKPGFLAELENVPDEVFSVEAKKQLKIVEDDSERDLRIITGQDIERMFLERHFGPREQGGNGLLPKLVNHLQQNGIPVTVDVTFLRYLYLQEVVQTIDTRVVAVTGAGPLPPLADLRRGR